MNKLQMHSRYESERDTRENLEAQRLRYVAQMKADHQLNKWLDTLSDTEYRERMRVRLGL